VVVAEDLNIALSTLFVEQLLEQVQVVRLGGAFGEPSLAV